MGPTPRTQPTQRQATKQQAVLSRFFKPQAAEQGSCTSSRARGESGLATRQGNSHDETPGISAGSAAAPVSESDGQDARNLPCLPTRDVSAVCRSLDPSSGAQQQQLELQWTQGLGVAVTGASPIPPRSVYRAARAWAALVASPEDDAGAHRSAVGGGRGGSSGGRLPWSERDDDAAKAAYVGSTPAAAAAASSGPSPAAAADPAMQLSPYACAARGTVLAVGEQGRGGSGLESPPPPSKASPPSTRIQDSGAAHHGAQAQCGVRPLGGARDRPLPARSKGATPPVKLTPLEQQVGSHDSAPLDLAL
jgi:hypothetical protein